jgi:hypothetical protein
MTGRPFAKAGLCYGPVESVNRPVRLPACGGDPHARYCVEGELEGPLYPIKPLLIKNPRNLVL